MINLKERVRPFYSAILAAILVSSVVLLAEEFYTRASIKSSVTAIITANQTVIDLEDYYQVLLASDRFSTIFHNFKSTAFYVRGKRVSGATKWPQSIEQEQLNFKSSFAIKRGEVFGYRSYYQFADQDYILAFEYKNKEYVTFCLLVLFFSFTGCLLFSYLVRRFDINGSQRIKNDFAVSLCAKTIHFVKTHLHYANEVYKWLKENHSKENQDIVAALDGYEKSQIELEGIRSVLRLSSFKTVQGNIDVEGAVAQLLRCYQSKDLIVQTYYSHKNKLALDKDIFFATVGNLIKNAIEYSAGLVWIKTEEKPGAFTISVSNTGRQLKGSQLREIYQKETSLHGSSGLGLSICRVWMKKVGGSIEMQSSKGSTTFELVFPNSLPPEVEKPKNTAVIDQPEDSNLRVVILEDIPSFQKKLRKKIEKLGATVHIFSDVDSFFEFFEVNFHSVNVIICDRHLRGFDAVRDRFPDACRHYGYDGKLILYTGDLSSALNQGADHQFDLVIKKDEEVDWKNILDS